jgi:hypothetical protein
LYETSELADARADFATEFFVQTCDVIREVRSTDGGYGQLTTPETAATYPCRVTDAKRDRRREEGETPIGTVRRQVQLPWNADIRKTDRLRIGGVTFGVIGSDAGRAEALCLIVDLQGT